MIDRSALFLVLLASTGLSINEASDFLGVEPRTIRRWITGGNPPQDAIDSLRALARWQDDEAKRLIELPQINVRVPRGDGYIFLETWPFGMKDHMSKSCPAGAQRAVARRMLEKRPHEIPTRLRCE